MAVLDVVVVAVVVVADIEGVEVGSEGEVAAVGCVAAL